MKNKRNFIKRYWIRLTIGLLIIAWILMDMWTRHNDELSVCWGDQCFAVEVARTQEEHQIWLMYRKSMSASSGMLFVFEASDIYNFRMKNTLIPLDMLRIDENNKVVKVVTAQPCTADPCPTYNPWVMAKYVLEINAWMAAKYSITEWTKMEFVNIQ